MDNGLTNEGHCQNCGRAFEGIVRKSRKYCGGTCRKSKSRANKALREQEQREQDEKRLRNCWEHLHFDAGAVKILEKILVECGLRTAKMATRAIKVQIGYILHELSLRAK